MDKLHTGIDLYLAGDLYAAIRTLKEYIAEGGSASGTAYYHIGIAYSDLQKLMDACEHLKKAVEIEPEKSMYHYRLGVVYSRLMILDSAIIELQRSIDLNPEHQRSRFILGTIHFQRGDMMKAREVFTSLIKSSPDFAAAYYNRAMAHYHLGDNAASIDDLGKALQLNPGYDEARLRLAYLCFNKGEYRESACQCDRIYNNGARDLIFLQHYINALYKSGQVDKAKDIAAEAAIIYPYNQDIRVFCDNEKDN